MGATAAGGPTRESGDIMAARGVRILAVGAVAVVALAGCGTPKSWAREARDAAAAQVRDRAEKARGIMEHDLTGDPASATDAQLIATLRQDLGSVHGDILTLTASGDRHIRLDMTFVADAQAPHNPADRRTVRLCTTAEGVRDFRTTVTLHDLACPAGLPGEVD